MLRKYWRKLLAPVIITMIAGAVLILMAIVYFGLGTVMLAFGGPVWLGGLMCLSCLVGCGASAYVLWERIKEIRSGEEDDLSQY